MFLNFRLIATAVIFTGLLFFSHALTGKTVKEAGEKCNYNWVIEKSETTECSSPKTQDKEWTTIRQHNLWFAFMSPQVKLKDEEKAEGFLPLFNGRDLSGWRGATDSYFAEEGKIVIHPKKGSGGNLYTIREYSDFVLRFEFKLTPGANNGLGIRCPMPAHAAYEGMELQILDNTAEKYKNLQPYQYHGSIYGVVPAKRGYLKPVEEWNYEEVIAKGRQITIKLNGVTIVDADIEKVSTPKTMDGKDHPGLKRKKGHIAFLGHGSHVEFRNIRIRELK